MAALSVLVADDKKKELRQSLLKALPACLRFARTVVLDSSAATKTAAEGQRRLLIAGRGRDSLSVSVCVCAAVLLGLFEVVAVDSPKKSSESEAKVRAETDTRLNTEKTQAATNNGIAAGDYYQVCRRQCSNTVSKRSIRSCLNFVGQFLGADYTMGQVVPSRHLTKQLNKHFLSLS